jgi:predicted MFS family arabinose efflux permease
MTLAAKNAPRTLRRGVLTGAVGVLLAGGIAFNVTRAVSVIWVNRRTTSDVRATVHSFLSQAETLGEIFGGFALAVLAQATSITAALMTSGALIACAGAMVVRSRADRAAAPAAAEP